MTVSNGPTPVIIDCDPGHDDAIALLLAVGNPRVDLLGVTTVAGNQTLERVTRNACAVLTLAGATDVPVVAGCDRPLLRPLCTAEEFHGASGLAGPPPFEPAVHPGPGHAADFLIEQVLARPGEVTLVAVGPLTNLALALGREPAIAGAVAGVTLMGGAYTRGNVTPAAEFNIYVDPDAAAAVFAAGWDVRMVGLEVTHQACYTPEVAVRVAALRNPVSTWVGELMAFFAEAYRHAGMPYPPVHDPCAVAAVIDPAVVTFRDAAVEVDTADGESRGRTVVEFDRAPSRHRVGVGVDAARFWDLVVAALGELPIGR